MNKAFIAQRCLSLQNYLNDIAKLPHIYEYEFMRTFLETSEVPHKSNVGSFLSSPVTISGNGSIIIESKNRSGSVNSGEDVGSTSSNSILGLEGKYSNKVLSRIEQANELLDLSSCSLESSTITEIVKQNWAISLLKLDISHNKLTTVPNLNHIVTLEHLIICDNKISKFNDEFQACVRLKTLEIRHNAITKLPSSLANFASITKLDVSHNSLNDISELYQLKSLVHFKASSNLLGTLSPSISSLTNLETIELIG